MKRFVWLLLIASAFAQSKFAGPSKIAGPSSTGSGVVATTVLFGGWGAGQNSTANIPLNWNTTPTVGGGEIVFFWHLTTTTVTSVCNGTGTDGCTGSDTFVSLGALTNTAHFVSEVYLLCNVTHTNAVIITPNAAAQVYADGIFFTGQTVGGCNDGFPAGTVNTGATPLTGPAVTTTNAHDLLTILASNACGGTAYAAGVDGQGNAMTDSGATNSGVLGISYRQLSATNTYTPTVTAGPTCATGGNAQTLAIK